MHTTSKWSRITVVTMGARRKRGPRSVVLAFSKDEHYTGDMLTDLELAMLNRIANPMEGVDEVRASGVAGNIIVDFDGRADDTLINLVIRVMCNRMEELTNHHGVILDHDNPLYDTVLHELTVEAPAPVLEVVSD